MRKSIDVNAAKTRFLNAGGYGVFIMGARHPIVMEAVERQLRTSFLERGLMGEMAARDGLTGLKNRGAFDDHFPRLWQQK